MHCIRYGFRWVDPDDDSSNGIDSLCQADMLRLDAMVCRDSLLLAMARAWYAHTPFALHSSA
jgi:hypothetical protein